MRFKDSKVSRDHRYALGTNTETGRPYLTIPVSNQLANYDEYYLLDDSEFDLFCADAAAGVDFAAKCGRRELDHRLIVAPGPDRGVY